MAKGGPRDYVISGSEDVDYLEWEGGDWEDESWGPLEGGTGDVAAGSEGYDGLTVAPSPADHWREEIATTAQRVQYVNNVLGLSRGDAGYSSALRYLGLIASGQRQPTSERWLAVQRVAEVNYELKHRDSPPPEPPRGGSRGPGNFRRGDYLSGSVSWEMAGEYGRRQVSGTLTLEGESLRLANDGQLVQAFIQGYFDGGVS